jgi:hypothetical protein
MEQVEDFLTSQEALLSNGWTNDSAKAMFGNEEEAAKGEIPGQGRSLRQSSLSERAPAGLWGGTKGNLSQGILVNLKICLENSGRKTKTNPLEIYKNRKY